MGSSPLFFFFLEIHMTSLEFTIEGITYAKDLTEEEFKEALSKKSLPKIDETYNIPVFIVSSNNGRKFFITKGSVSQKIHCL